MRAATKSQLTTKGSRAAAIVVALLIMATIAEVRGKYLRHWIDDKLYDNWNHYLPCDKLPTDAQVEEALRTHADVVRRIERMGAWVASGRPGHCTVGWDIEIRYGAH